MSGEGLTDFLLARLAEDADTLVHYFDCDRFVVYDYGTRQGPCDCGAQDRVLADVAAKRRIVELHERAVWIEPARRAIGVLPARPEGSHLGGCVICASDDSGATWPCDTLRALAQPYADHADFREEWRV